MREALGSIPSSPLFSVHLFKFLNCIKPQPDQTISLPTLFPSSSPPARLSFSLVTNLFYGVANSFW
ncbi:uncharacterized protein CANTADRAFT_281410 [Suhomyces tanzawaensis NRRL Y-17324]|uniref:Uncharacterized protein n=1 Tax=Suhomyces tanzawaensis NRRL Y-17324 TaxID=984487 RepID=A0A1E4SE23_9ASCO|nr:uncharacterized protein CANTADRAFT_281410 [Suhomyces tanzawaensis NRRL Y-17324]ODV77771.1 hypothetical protein CANTADRAFT_281410 [Suhomyces tanzawaensis NRRL Y-17324]